MLERIEYVSQAQFGQTMSLLTEMRTDLRMRMDDLGDQLEAGVAQITTRQDEANHRTLTLEAAVTEIHDRGCATYDRHKKMAALIAAREPERRIEPLQDDPVYSEELAPFSRLQPLSPRVKRIAIGGGLLASGAGLNALMPHVWEGLHWLVHVLSGGAI